MNRPDLSIVTLNWNVAHLVDELLASIVAGTHGVTYEILLADNGSKDGIEDVVARFRAKHPHVALTYLPNGRNLGFAAGNNPAIRLAKGRHVVLLNPDTRVTDGALPKMVAWMDAHPDVGIAGPRLVNPDGSLQASVRRFPGLLDQALILLKLPHFWPSAPPFRKYLAHGFDYGKEQDVDQVMGAALFMRREVFEAIGLLDEAFFIWFEEVDFCKRAKDAGWRVVYVPSVTVIHHLGASFAQAMTLRKQRYFGTSMATYFRKHRGAWTLAVLALPLAIGLLSAATLSLWASGRKR